MRALLDSGDRIVHLKRLSDRNAALGFEVVVAQAAMGGVTKRYAQRGPATTYSIVATSSLQIRSGTSVSANSLLVFEASSFLPLAHVMNVRQRPTPTLRSTVGMLLPTSR